MKRLYNKTIKKSLILRDFFISTKLIEELPFEHCHLGERQV